MQPYSWIFVDGASQQTFRIRCGDPAWETDEDGKLQQARCSFNIRTEDGTDFQFLLRISGGVLEGQGVDSTDQLLSFIRTKVPDIVEGAIHRGIRGDQQILWDPDGVSLAT